MKSSNPKQRPDSIHSLRADLNAANAEARGYLTRLQIAERRVQELEDIDRQRYYWHRLAGLLADALERALAHLKKGPHAR